MDRCRACLSTEESLIAMNEEFVYNYNILTNLDVKTSDNLHQLVCESCIHAVKFFIEFREKCILSEASLRSASEEIKLENDLSQDVENIKTEYEVAVDFGDAMDDGDLYPDTMDCKGDIKIDIKKEDLAVETNDSVCEKPLKKRKRNRKDYREGTEKRKYKKRAKVEPGSNIIMLPCGLCNKQFDDKNALSQHYDIHKESKTCPTCFLLFRDWPQLLAHRFKHLPKKQYHCHMCSRRFHSSYNIEYHYRQDHFGEKNARLYCNACNTSYATPRTLRKHMWAFHSNKQYTCDYCGKTFPNKSNLKLHIIAHMNLKSYRCHLCEFTCNRSTTLKNHMLYVHTTGKVYCKMCKRIFKDQATLDTHQIKCRLKAPLILLCPICGLGMTRRDRLKAHMDTHKDIGKYKCPRCPITYKTKGALKAHIDRHDGIRRLKCEFCSLTFFQYSTLTKHRRVHTGEKPYVCTICSKGFTANHNLKVHMKVHGVHNLIVKKGESND